MSDAAARAPRPVGVGVLGLGFMGRTHVAAYRRAAAASLPNRLVAVCDPDPARREGRPAAGGNLRTGASGERLFDPRTVRACADPAELLADPDVDLVSVCTPTDTHVELAVAALASGKHVLVEKPVALTARAARRLAAAAADAPGLCMPALCVRFWPAWTWLRERVRSGDLGPVRSATFRRLAAPPAWSPDFYRDPARTGGALFDLHVHDADFARWCFGDPTEVTAAGSIDHLTALWRYGPDGPPHVALEGGWDLSPGAPFRMEYTVVFERGTADHSSAAGPNPWLARDGRRKRVRVPDHDGYDGEIRHLLDTILHGRRDLTATVADAVGHLHLIEAERESLATAAPVRVTPPPT